MAQGSQRVAFLGPKGTYSEEALLKHFGGVAETLPRSSIRAVVGAVEAGEVEAGVVPVENSTEGGIGVTLDLMLDTDMQIVAEVLLPIHHCLLSDTKALHDVETVYAHAQALGQCALWLERELGHASLVAVASSVEAVQRAGQDPSGAAIASAGAAKLYQIGMLAQDIEDERSNTTRFWVIAPARVGTHATSTPSGRHKTSLVMSAPNRSGGLYELLGCLSRNGLSMSRIESRPAHTGPWEYVFFLDIEGHVDHAPVQKAIGELRERGAFVKVLGAYPWAAESFRPARS